MTRYYAKAYNTIFEADTIEGVWDLIDEFEAIWTKRLQSIVIHDYEDTE